MPDCDEWREMASKPVNGPNDSLRRLLSRLRTKNIDTKPISLDDEKASPPVEVSLTGPSTGMSKAHATLYTKSTIDINTPFAFICEHQTPEKCAKARADDYLERYGASPLKLAAASRTIACCHDRIHFQPLMLHETRTELGDCNWFDLCTNVGKGCPYVHYVKIPPRDPLPILGVQMLKASKFETDPAVFDALPMSAKLEELKKLAMAQIGWRALGPAAIPSVPFGGHVKPLQPQFINCDIRNLDLSMLGDFAVVMADPPWPIHMDLPYSTLREEELLDLRVEQLSKQGLLFLWITMRSTKLGIRLLKKWGYEMAGSLTWIKTNQLNRMIVTGKTGHWLNHAKETCLIGIKGSAAPFGDLFPMDTDCILAPLRETSRKPDEIYDMIERLAGPAIRKVELFGRVGNIRPGWVTIGNQLAGNKGDHLLLEDDMKEKVNGFFDAGTTGVTHLTDQFGCMNSVWESSLKQL